MCEMIFPGYYELLTRNTFVLGLEIFKKYNNPEEIKKKEKRILKTRLKR